MHLLAVAPMMGYTDRHFRYLLRLISQHTLLYTEMLTTGAILKGTREHLLHYDPAEHPLALQVGGSDPLALAECAKIAEDHGYDEINLNVGCPSDRVQSARFGACLMAEPELVARCVMAMRTTTTIPVTVKTRIGIDNQDSYQHLIEFITTVANAGCETFIIHARKAWLKGLSPKENREVPPLRYDVVRQIKQDFPQLKIMLNGGITELKQINEHLTIFDGVMLGRVVYQNPYLLAMVDREIHQKSAVIVDRHTICMQYLSYVTQQLSRGVPLAAMTRHLLGLFHGVPGANAWRRHLTEQAFRPQAGIEVLTAGIRLMQ